MLGFGLKKGGLFKPQGGKFAVLLVIGDPLAALNRCLGESWLFSRVLVEGFLENRQGCLGVQTSTENSDREQGAREVIWPGRVRLEFCERLCSHPEFQVTFHNAATRQGFVGDFRLVGEHRGLQAFCERAWEVIGVGLLGGEIDPAIAVSFILIMTNARDHANTDDDAGGFQNERRSDDREDHLSGVPCDFSCFSVLKKE